MFELTAFLTQIDLPLILADVTTPVATPSDPISAIYNILLNNGLMGAAVALLIYLLIRRDGELQRSQAGRLEDAKSLAEIVKSHTVILAATNTTQEERNRALEITAQAAQKSAIVIEQLSKQLDYFSKMKESK